MGCISYNPDPSYITLKGNDICIVDQADTYYDYCCNRKQVKIEATQLDVDIEKTIQTIQSCFLDQWYSSVEEAIMMDKTFNVSKVYFNGPATIILWKDGEKTVVRISKSDKKTKSDRRIAVMWALAKRYFGSRSQLEKRLRDARDYGAKNDNATVRSLLVALFKSTKNLDDFIDKIVSMAKEN